MSAKWQDSWDQDIADFVRSRLTTARQNAGMTLNEVAELSGLHPQAVYAVLAGVRTANFTTMCRIAYAINGRLKQRAAARANVPHRKSRRNPKSKGQS